MPLDELLATDASSAHYRDSHGASIFYAQSWALTHFILFGDDTKTAQATLSNYLELMKQGLPQERAFDEAFDDPDELEAGLRAYVRQRQFPALRMDRPHPMDASELASRKLSPAESHARRGSFFVHNGQLTEAQFHIEKALELDPGEPIALEAKGLLLVRHGDWVVAPVFFEKALSADPNRHLPHYYLGLMAGQAYDDEERVSRMQERLEQSVSLNPSHAPALARLAILYRFDDARHEEALSMAERAAALMPDDAISHASLGVALRCER